MALKTFWLGMYLLIQLLESGGFLALLTIIGCCFGVFVALWLATATFRRFTE